VVRLAGITLGPEDRIFEHGQAVDASLAVAAGPRLQIQVKSPIQIHLNGQPLQTTALTVGDVLLHEGIELHAVDGVEPPPDSPVSPGLDIHYSPSLSMRLGVDGQDRPLRSTSVEIGAALAEAGLPIVGLDLAEPLERFPVPEDSQIRLARVSESLILLQEPIPFELESRESPELELGLEQVLEPGLSGLAVSRTRIKYRDGLEISRQVESQAVVRPPKDRLVVRGTKLIEKTATVDGLTISYWREMQMYATVYSPCNSGTGDGSCSSGTASGLPAGKGVVAVDPDLFAYLNGQKIYIPGYGYAVVGDVGGGYIVEENLGISRYKWIDLGFDDNNIQDMTGWITVYFLPPVPLNIPDALK
jgi:uncharacterized protein YabE (DUF348 family)